MTRFAHLCALAATAALAGCGPSDNEPSPAGVTVGEAKALDQAAEMIEQRRLPPGAIAQDDTAEQDEQSGEGEPAVER